MKLIAHRGLTNGPNKEIENDPTQIINAINQGYDCEIDLWVVDGELILGHDNPQYTIKELFLFENKLYLWIHAKNLEALHWLLSRNYRYFWHQNDDFTLTSSNHIWAFPGKPLTNNSISVLPEWNDPEFKNLNLDCYGICSDYVEKIKDYIRR